MPDVIKWRSKILLLKMETTYGVDPTPLAANGILAKNVTYKPMEGEDVSRDLEFPYLAAQGMIPVGLRVVLEFETELVGSGTVGTAPAWGPLARLCAMSQTVNVGVSVVYAPVSESHESASCYFWVGGTRQVVKGIRGSGIIRLNAQGIPVVRWTLTGLYADPSETARVSPTLTSWKKPAVATHANTPVFTVNGVSLVMRSFELNFGNKVTPRLLIGREEIAIVDRAESIDIRVEAVPVSTLNPFALARAQTEVPIALTHGTAAGFIVAVAAPTSQLMRLPGYENQDDALEWPLGAIPLPAAGNDQFSITLT